METFKGDAASIEGATLDWIGGDVGSNQNASIQTRARPMNVEQPTPRE